MVSVLLTFIPPLFVMNFVGWESLDVCRIRVMSPVVTNHILLNCELIEICSNAALECVISQSVM